MMKFSVLMSVYKNDNYIFFEKALKSVTTEQTYKPHQVVIIKDGWVDTAIDDVINDVAKHNPEIEFSVTQNENNLGLAASLNKGIDLCKYEWIARMDADDIAVPERFEKQCRYILENGNVDIVGGMISEFLESPNDIVSERRLETIHNRIVGYSKHRTPMNHMTVFYKKEKLIAAGKYDETYGKLEDYKLWIDLIICGAIFANIDEILVYVRIGNGFYSRRSNKREIADWDNLQYYMKKNDLINLFEVICNRMAIRLFVFLPAWAKKILYVFLRGK